MACNGLQVGKTKIETSHSYWELSKQGRAADYTSPHATPFPFPSSQLEGLSKQAILFYSQPSSEILAHQDVSFCSLISSCNSAIVHSVMYFILCRFYICQVFLFEIKIFS